MKDGDYVGQRGVGVGGREQLSREILHFNGLTVPPSAAEKLN